MSEAKKKKIDAFVMSLTPFDSKGRLDENGLRHHLRRLRDAGVPVYVAGSAAGEAFSLTPDERDQVLQIGVEELKGRVTVRAMGVEPHNLEAVMGFVRRAEHYKLDAVHIFAPEMGHGAKPNAAELEAYLSTAIESTALPVVLSSYDAMGFVLPIGVVERLAHRFANLIGIFYGGSDLIYLTELTERLGGRLEVHCAGPYNALTTMGLGGNGFMGHEGNLCPELVAAVAAAFQTSDTARLCDAFSKLMAVHVMHKAHGGAAGRAMKPLLAALGLPGGMLRPPRLPIHGEVLRTVIEATLALHLPGLPKQTVA